MEVTERTNFASFSASAMEGACRDIHDGAFLRGIFNGALVMGHAKWGNCSRVYQGTRVTLTR